MVKKRKFAVHSIDQDVLGTNQPKMNEEQQHLSSIYTSIADDETGEPKKSSKDRFFFNKGLNMTNRGHVNPAFVDDEDSGSDVESYIDRRCNSDSEDDYDTRRSYRSGSFTSQSSYRSYRSSRRSSYGDTGKLNGHLVNEDKDFKIGLSSLRAHNKPPTQPPKPAKPKEKRDWDRFTTSTKDTFTSEDKQFWDRVFIATKITVAIVLFILTLGTAVISKICFFIITANMLPPLDNDHLKTVNGTLKYHLNGETNVLWIWALITLIGSPYLFTLCRNVWRTWFQLASRGSPPILTILLVLFIESIHSVGLILIAFVVVPNLDPISGVLMSLCIGVVPGILKAYYPSVEKNDVYRGEQTSRGYLLGRTASIIGAIGQILAIGVWCYHIYVMFGEKFERKSYFACVILSPIMASIHWWENFVHEGKKDSSGLPLLARHIRKSRTRLTLYACIWKAVLTILIPMALFGTSCLNGKHCVNILFFKESIGSKANVSNSMIDTVLNAEKKFGKCDNHLPIIIAAIGVLCSGACFKLGKMGCKIMTQIVDYSLPLVLSTPATIGIILGMYSGFITTEGSGCSLPFPVWQHSSGDYFSVLTSSYKMWLNVVAGLVGFLSLLLVTNYIWFPGKERLQRTDRLFVQPLYCGIFTDISLMLNRRRIEKVNISDTRKTKVKEQKLYEDENIGRKLQEKSVFTDLDTPIIYMCATMWHETENEMTQLLKSVFRMDEDQCTRKNTQYLLNRKDPDYYEFEAHIFFDDAYEKHKDDQYDFTVNEYVKLLKKTVNLSACAIQGHNYKLKAPTQMGTPYGGRLTWTLPGGNKLIAHLKDKAVIRHRKRWSQVMYMYYFLAYQLYKANLARKQLRKRADNTFLLALDGDVDFYPSAVQLLVDRMKKNQDVGAACGRIHPIGNGAMVWYQKFEYAISHWLQKAAEDKLGCVLCSPGCFSLFRGSALMDENVMNKYTTPPTEPRHHVQYDQGEDRWLCTLLLQQGHRVEYCAASDALTYAPEGFYEFFKQRRRWMPSTMANIMDLLTDWKNVTEKNPEISLLYVAYQALLMVSSILTPGTIFLMILGAINMAYPDIDLWVALLINGLPIGIMVLLCFTVNDQKQLTYAAILSTAYSLIMMIVIVGLLVQAAKFGICSITTVFISFVGGVFVLSALIHPQEFWCIIHGFLYFLAIPSMSMILMIYSLGNLHVVTWGTRENKVAGPVTEEKKEEKLPGCFSVFDRFFASKQQVETQNMHAIMDRLDGIEESILRISGSNILSRSPSSRFSDKNSLFPRSKSPAANGPYVVGEVDKNEKISRVGEFVLEATGGGKSENPIYSPEKQTPRDRLRNPYWMTDDADFNYLPKQTLDQDEVKFWDELIEEYLRPIDLNPEKQKADQAALIELRNKVCLIFILINSLFIIIVFTLQQVVAQGESIELLLPCADKDASPQDRLGQSIEPISVAFTLTFGLLLFVQFTCMLMHRLATLLHICAATDIFKAKTKLPQGQSGVEMGTEPPPDEKFSYDQVYEMVRDMQKDQDIDSISITSESSYAQSEVDEEEYIKERKEASKNRWKRITTKATKFTQNSLHENFMKNVSTLQKVMVSKKNDETDDEEDEDAHLKRIKKETKFNRMRNKSLHILASMSRDKSMKEQLQKKKVKAKWKELGAAVIYAGKGEKRKFSDIVKAATAKDDVDHIEKLIVVHENETTGEENTKAKEYYSAGKEESGHLDAIERALAEEALDEATDNKNDQGAVTYLTKSTESPRSSSKPRVLIDTEMELHTPKVEEDEWPEEKQYVSDPDQDFDDGSSHRISRL